MASGQKNEKQQIMEALTATNGRIYGEKGAAKLLGMNPERLRSRMRVYGVYGLKRITGVSAGPDENKTV